MKKHLKDTLEKSEKVTTREINNRRVSATPIKGFREASNSSFFNLIDYYIFILKEQLTLSDVLVND